MVALEAYATHVHESQFRVKGGPNRLARSKSEPRTLWSCRMDSPAVPALVDRRAQDPTPPSLQRRSAGKCSCWPPRGSHAKFGIVRVATVCILMLRLARCAIWLGRSVQGQKQTGRHSRSMSAQILKADVIARPELRPLSDRVRNVITGYSTIARISCGWRVATGSRSFGVWPTTA
jgi:hypothetical protein